MVGRVAIFDGKLAEEREREKRRAQLRKKGLLLERDDYCADLSNNGEHPGQKVSSMTLADDDNDVYA